MTFFKPTTFWCRPTMGRLMLVRRMVATAMRAEAKKRRTDGGGLHRIRWKCEHEQTRPETNGAVRVKRTRLETEPP